LDGYNARAAADRRGAAENCSTPVDERARRVDGTLIEAWASMKSIKPKGDPGEPPAPGGGRNAEADFHGQKRSNDTHASTTDPDARLYRKGKGKERRSCASSDMD
jgi:hypothetical protein